jgi:predicted secreted protein
MKVRSLFIGVLLTAAAASIAVAEPVRPSPSADRKPSTRTPGRVNNGAAGNGSANNGAGNGRTADGSDVSAAISRLAISPARTVVFTEEREAAARTFVRINRPEMETVLDQLQKSKPDEYRQVICDLFRTVESFTAMRQEDPQRYELSVQTWRTEAKTHLLAAELVGKPAERERITAELRTAVGELADLQVQMADHEVRRAEAKLRRAEGQKQKLQARRTEIVDERVDAILQAVGRVQEGATVLEGAKKEEAK